MTREFMWLKHGELLPEGWQFCKGQMVSHHHYYRVLIMREITA